MQFTQWIVMSTPSAAARNEFLNLVGLPLSQVFSLRFLPLTGTE